MDLLKRPWAIRAQVSYYLFAFRIYDQVRRIYEKTIDEKSVQVGQPYLQLAKFPHLWPVFKWYQRFTNVAFIYALLKYIYPDLLPSALRKVLGADQLAGLPLHCFLPGRFVAYPRLDGIVAILHAVANLSWRVTLQNLQRPYRLDLIEFLIQKDCHTSEYSDQMELLKIRRQKLGCDDQDEEQWRQKFHLFHSFMSYNVVTTKPRKLTARQEGGAAAEHNKCLRMRPNRSLDAKRWLEWRMSRMCLLVTMFLGGLSVITVSLVVREITSDSRYLKAYPGCDRELERILKERHPIMPPLGLLTSRTGTRLHVALGIIDFIESLSIWFESGLGITFVYILPYILLQDLKCYWRLWNARLNWLLHEARLSFPLSAGRVIAAASSATSKRHGATILQVRARQFEQSIDELRQEIRDFFNQFQQYELLMSDIISATFVFWFLGIIGMGYTLSWLYASGHTLLNLPLPLVIVFTLTFFSSIIGLFSGCIFQLQGDCSKSYQTLHSLMTYMKPEAKEEYLKIMEFFSEQKRHQFRFLLGHRYTPTTVVSILSWTSSWLALLMSIVK